MFYVSHLECSAGCGAGPFDPRERHHLCPCGQPLLVRYHLNQVAAVWRKETLADRAPTMWRYAEMMPLLGDGDPVTLGEGFTPLLHAQRLGRALGLSALYVKDESLNPTNSFKARGLSAAVTRAHALKASTLSVPSAGNAANAMSAYAAQAGIPAKVFMPKDVKQPFIRECELYGADVTLVDGLITDAGRVAVEQGGPLGWYDVSTLKEPYRIEGKKTMAYELAEQLDWQWPDWIIYPTGGGTGMIGMWKAMDELESIGWVPKGKRPRMVTAQAGRIGMCADRPGVRRGHREGRAVGECAHRGGWPARAEGDRRLSHSPRTTRERRPRHRRVGRRHGALHAGPGPIRGDQRSARERRRPRRPARAPLGWIGRAG